MVTRDYAAAVAQVKLAKSTAQLLLVLFYGPTKSSAWFHVHPDQSKMLIQETHRDVPTKAGGKSGSMSKSRVTKPVEAG